METRIQRKIEEIVNRWNASPLAARVTESDTIAQERLGVWDGMTIAEFWVHQMQDFATFIEGELIEEQERQRVEAFIADEQAKIDRADRLTAKLRSYWFGPLDPRYHRTAKELNEVVSTFKLGTSSIKDYANTNKKENI